MENTIKKKIILIVAIWIYWWTRLHNLEALAVFLDEAAHIWWARLVWEIQPFHAASDGRLFNIIWTSLFWPFNSSLWIARASTIMVTVIGFITTISIAHQLHSKQASIIAGILYVFLPYISFFERMYLADPYMSTCGILLLWSSTKLSYKPYLLKNKIIVGMTIAAGMLSKISFVVFLPVPFIAAAILNRSDKKHFIASAHAYILGIILLTPVIIILKFIGNSDMGIDLLYKKTSSRPIDMWQQAITSAPILWNYFTTLFTPSVWYGGLILIPLAIWKHTRVSIYIGTTILIGLVAVITTINPGFLEARFILPYATQMVILMSMGIATAWKSWQSMTKNFNFLLVTIFGISLYPAYQFITISWNEPHQLQLPDRDKWEYVTGWPSGYGFQEIAKYYQQSPENILLITLDLGGQQRLNTYLPPNSPITPVWTPPDKLESYLNTINNKNYVIIIDSPKDNATVNELNINLSTILEFPRPNKGSSLIITKIQKKPY